MPTTSSKVVSPELYRKRNPYRVDWYARDGTIRQSWFRTLREAREEAAKHKDAEVFKEIH